MTSTSSEPRAQLPAVDSARIDAPRSRRPWTIGTATAVVVAAAGLLVPSILTDPYSMGLAVEAAILGLLALSIGFLARYLGLISLGHTAFYGAAGYGVAIATTRWGWTPLQAAVFAIAVAVLLAVAMGVLVVRATGMAFLMLTLAFGQALYQLCVQTSARPLTGAHDGLLVTFNVDQTFLGMTGRDVVHAATFWPLAWIALVAAALGAWLLGRSSFGTVLEGIRENEERMRFSGYNTFLPRLIAFTASGLVSAVAGVLYALHTSFVSPSMLGFLKAGDTLIAAIIGGLGLLLGPVVGAAVYIWVQANFNTNGNLHLYMGITLVIVLMFVPGGLLGGTRDLIRRLRRLRRDRGAR